MIDIEYDSDNVRGYVRVSRLSVDGRRFVIMSKRVNCRYGLVVYERVDGDLKKVFSNIYGNMDKVKSAHQSMMDRFEEVINDFNR